MQKINTSINLNFIGATILTILFFLLPLFLDAQDKYEYEIRTDLTFQERVNLAEAYFNKNGKNKGTGYVQFQRWKYWAQRSVNANGYVITSATIQKQVKQFDALHGNQATNFVNNSFTEMGPMSATNTSTWSSALGRLTSFDVANDNTFNHIIVGAPSGGVWKTTNGGTNWTPIFDNMPTLSILSVAISPANAQHYFVGTSGGGIYKSTNGGSSWTQATGVDSWDSINTIRIDPNNANILYAIGQWAGKVYKSTDNGSSWSTIYESIDPSTNRANRLYDLELKPGTSSTIYISGRGVLFKSTNSGSTFSSVNLPSPYVSTGTIMMGVSPANPNYIYALQENFGRFNALFRSTNSGDTFTLRSDNSNQMTNLLGYEVEDNRGQAPRDMDVIASPTDINEVQVAGIETHRSFDGGTTFTKNSSWVLGSEGLTFHHADVDALFYVLRNGVNRIFAVTDGGLYFSDNKGVDFTDLTPGIGTRQFYRIGVSKTVKDWVSGGSQDNGTGVHRSDGKWYDWLGADGMETVIDFSNANIMYGTSQNGGLYISENGGDTYRYPDNVPPGSGAWVTPLEQDPVNAATIYMGYQNLYKSTDGADNWTAISNFPLPPEDIDNDTTLQHVKIAPSSPSTIYAAFDSRLYKTTNGGANWTAISPTGYDYYYITYMTIHPTNPNRLMLALSHNSESHRFIESTNGGTTWADISSNLPFIGPQCALYTGNADDGIYVGMSPGLYYKDNSSNGNWANIGTNGGLPNVSVSELEIQHGTLYMATYGRGLWKTVIGAACDTDLALNSSNLSGDYMATNTITSTGQINSGSTVTMQAENSVQLNANFHAKNGATFTATIGTCTLSAITSEADLPETQRIQSSPIDHFNPKEVVLQIRPNPIRDYAVIRFYTANQTKATISVANLNGQLLTQQTTDSAEGWNMTQLEANQLPTGTYLVVLTTDTGRWSKKIMIQK